MGTAEHLLIVGRRGIGTSTTAANLAAALAEAGSRVVVVGYSADGLSTSLLRGGRDLRPLDGWHDGVTGLRTAAGFRDTLCVEAGEDAAGGDLLREALNGSFLFGEHDPAYIIHDVSWPADGTFLIPAACEGVARIYAVTSADMAAIMAVNGLFAWLNSDRSHDCRFGGVIANNLSGGFYESIVNDYVSRAATKVVARIPRSIMVSVSDFYRQTLIEAAPLSHNAYAYRRLAHAVAQGAIAQRPMSLADTVLRQWAQEWGDIINEMETGVVREGGCI